MKNQLSSTFQDLLHRKKITTAELADFLRISPKSAISSLCRKGHYLGMRPCKLANGRLLWDADEVSRLLNGEDL